MSQDPNREVDETIGRDQKTDPLDAALAQAFTPESTHPLNPQGSVLRSISSCLPGPISYVHLRDPEEEAPSPVVRPVPPGPVPAPEPKGPAGRYQIAGEIARGGMGSILRGRDMDLGRDLALKVLLESHRARPELVQRFVEEAQITGQLQHPGIPPVYELGQLSDQRPYFAMKLVKGRTLLAILSARKNPIDDRPRFIAIFSQLTQTLAYAHARGVIHRDLKPSNIMVGAFGEVQVMDWGLAKVLGEGGVADEKKARERRADVSVIRTARSEGSGRPGTAGSGSGSSQTQAGSVLGTPAYMPPEQARGDIDRLDERADVFGLGAILCEILTGKPPYEGDDSSIVCSLAQRGDLAPARARLDASGADGELVGLASRCLAPDRKDRPADAGVVAEEVTAYLRSVEARLRQVEHEGVAARTRAVEEQKRRRLAAALAGAVLLVAGAAGGLWLHFKSERQALVASATREATEALADAEKLRNQAKAAGTGAGAGEIALWDRSRKRLDLATVLVSNGLVDPAVASQLRQDRALLDEEEKDAQLLAALDRAATAQITTNEKEDLTARDRAFPLFREAFRAYGLPPGEIAVPEAARRIRERPEPVRGAVIAGLDEWIAYAKSNRETLPEPNYEWLRSVVQEADRDDPWRSKVREAAGRQDRATLEKIVAEAEAMEQPPLELSVIAEWLFDLEGRESALELLRKARFKYPTDFTLNHILSVLYNRLEGDHLSEVIRYESVAVALQPRSARARVVLGRALFFAKDREGGVRELQKALELEPGFQTAWSILGYMLSEQGKKEEAVAAVRRALELSPTSALDWNNLGHDLRSIGKKEEGLAAFRRSLELDPRDTGHRANLARELTNDGRWEEALALTTEGLNAKPVSVGLHLALGFIHWKGSKRFQEAKSAYRRALDLRPGDGQALHDLGHVLQEDGDLEGALAALRQAVRNAPQIAFYHGCLAGVLLEKGESEEGMAEYREAVKLDPKDSSTRNTLAWALFLAGKLDEAIPIAEEAVALSPREATFHDTLAQALARRGDLERAVASFREALRLDPRQVESRSGLRSALLQLGKPSEVILDVVDQLERAPENGAEIFRPLARATEIARRSPELAAALAKLVETIERVNASDVKRRPDLQSLRIAVEAERRLSLGEDREAMEGLEEAENLGTSSPLLERRLQSLWRKALPELPTFGSIDAALEGEPLIAEGDAWRYFPGTTEPSPGLEWTRSDFDDGIWKESASGFGYGDDDDRTLLNDMRGRFTTVYVRRRVEIPSPEVYARLVLEVRSDDGFVAHWNGEEVGRFRAGAAGSRLSHDAKASEHHEAVMIDAIPIPATLVRPGENLIAIMGLNHSKGSAGFSLIPELRGEFTRDSVSARRRAAPFSTGTPAAGAPARAAYLEGRLLQVEGKTDQSLAQFEAASAASPRELLPLLRLLQCLDDLGKSAEADNKLRSAEKALHSKSLQALEARRKKK